MPMDTALYHTRQIRQFEHKAIHEQGVPEEELMLRAGIAAYEALRKSYNTVRHIAVFCGGGNNAGDGYVLARLAKEDDLSVVIYHNRPIKELPPAARLAAKKAAESGVPFQHFDEALDSDVELIVDALLGIGLEGEVRDPIKAVIELINDSGLPVLALDVPSGLNADTGAKLGVCVQANLTTTFIAPKVGMYTLDGPDHCGEIICADLGIKNGKNIRPAVNFLDQQVLHKTLSPRLKNVHKGLFGHVLIVGGGKGMPGAPCLAAMAAMRVGCGMVTVATHPDYGNQVIPALPEAMISGIASAKDLAPLIARASVCVLGPGLGESPWAKSLFDAVISAQLPLIVDASALSLLASNQQHDDNWILTPHPGEAAKLLSCTVPDVQKDRLKSVHALQQKYGGCVVLKGVGTVIDVGHNELFLCSAGNPGMATAGMGDVLSGVIAGLLAQGASLQRAAQLGVWLHAKAGDSAAAKHGERGLLATDLLPFLGK